MIKFDENFSENKLPRIGGLQIFDDLVLLIYFDSKLRQFILLDQI